MWGTKNRRLYKEKLDREEGKKGKLKKLGAHLKRKGSKAGESQFTFNDFFLGGQKRRKAGEKGKRPGGPGRKTSGPLERKREGKGLKGEKRGVEKKGIFFQSRRPGIHQRGCTKGRWRIQDLKQKIRNRGGQKGKKKKGKKKIPIGGNCVVMSRTKKQAGGGGEGSGRTRKISINFRKDGENTLVLNQGGKREIKWEKRRGGGEKKKKTLGSRFLW